MKKWVIRVGGIGLALAIIGGGFAYWYGFIRKEKPMEKQKADFEVVADDLFKEFSANEQSATAKYGGKILIVRSTVVSVEKELTGGVTVTLVDPMMGVTCTIDSLQVAAQKKEIAALSEGTPISIKGRCDGMLTDVKLSKCLVVK